MIGLARVGVVWWIALAAVTVVIVGGCGDQAPTVPSSNEALYEDPNYAPDTDLDGDVPAASYGGYTFDSTSHQLTNPYVALGPSSHGWVFREWIGSPPTTGGGAMILDASYGGTVRGVKTTRVRRIQGGDGYEDELIWLAQDTVGNVHWLKTMVLAAEGGPEPAQYVGVLHDDPAWFLVPNAPTVGQTWYHETDGVRLYRHRVLTTTATFRGHVDLLRVQRILDDDGDEVFNTGWDGPDDRDDWYFETDTGLFNITMDVDPDRGMIRF